jgi:hypothetical protein
MQNVSNSRFAAKWKIISCLLCAYNRLLCSRFACTLTRYWFFGLEHQPSPRGWVESSHKKVLFWAGPGPISFLGRFRPSLFLGRVGLVQKKFKNHFGEICDFPTYFSTPFWLISVSYPLESSTSRRPFLVAGIDVGVFVLWKRESPPSIMVTRKPNWSFRDSKARDWLRKGKVLAPLVRPT